MNADISEWPKDPANGRLLCSTEHPMPKGAPGNWAHTNVTCTYSGDYYDRYECRDCGARWSVELPE